MSRILIFGPGYLGNAFNNVWDDAVLTLERADDPAGIERALDEHSPEFVLSAVGKTGRPNVDWCESNQLETIRGNVLAPLMLAEACQKRGIHMTHLASGCIFYGESPDPAGWREDDFANPSAMYSRSKYSADLVLATLRNVAIVRLRMPIDGKPGPRNLITKLAHYPKIVDVENSVTVVPDLINAVRQLMEKRGQGVFHAVNDGTMRHRDLMALYKELVDPEHRNEWISTDELVSQGLAVKGRSNCILQNNRLKELGIEMRPIHVALRECMERYAEAVKVSKM
ncbi:sugar nucleotide-binding protein [Patescibacteria group bacterium]|uniref:dTDP-4-dehydrorhamnose reductase n=1 Tax=candidate division WWE3 bacterium TaxID=2053526 RepID=A0A928TSS2_UNCKA|nr:sugar nucleotide-binding protein [candidate division WWE3 bacterium]MCL4732703.1 sugar nucleotide-binding protein [Patescibacteria group bacterium]MDL1952965.1 NAD-dependent epimerase/dehydratase family protein [Candidatus Uhrbacteria bacterium UHB]RIL00682.1 MAG: hypothetical protein DCC77_04020 [Candidatus Uhrbacteria bacterium]